ncbi:uncharacterized protein LOC122027888 [Zingiber officinale]|uniref:Uncharacterized protein n=1 Tax=Zingiber officinale TaxID=94328 RepID=A0A8J5EVH7_ZINOF|nr:uncharacterized protein LOC122027888 [Zingiber officinale]KAG6473776.1 hypothetical protein ZIOFF_067693 [Zingiber officinale]
MANLLYHVFAFFGLFSYGLYHLISAVRSYNTSSSSATTSPRLAIAIEHAARPYYPLALSAHRHHLLRHLPIYLSFFSLFVAVVANVLLSAGDARADAQRFSFLESASALLFFLLSLSLTLLLPLPTDIIFLLAALAFALLSAASAHSSAVGQQSELQSKCDALSSLIFSVSAAAALALAVAPRLFIAELVLSASIALQGLWSLQAGFSLYVEAFIPEGCHRLLGVRYISTSCDLEDSRIRAFAILDLAFTVHAILIAVVTFVVYVSLNPAPVVVGGLVRRHNGGSYEALTTLSSTGALSDMDHMQMKVLSKSSTQA